jgi:hypothetical protein
MTKKDYIAIAGAIRELVDSSLPYEPMHRYHDIAMVAFDLADKVFAPDNPRFDRTRFLKACGMGGVNE